jgi:hypothetical protein
MHFPGESMKYFLALVCLIVLCLTTQAQNQRIELTTDSNKVVDLSTTTYDFGAYKNNTFKLGYNSDVAGNKIVDGEVDFAVRFEPKWSMSEGYHTEIYLEWTSANGTILKKRPWGFNIVDATGDVIGRMQGRWSFFDNAGNQTGMWLQEGVLDFYTANGAVRFRNNVNAIRAYNTALTGDVTLLKFDNQNRVVLSPDGAPIVLGGPIENIYYTGRVYKRGDTDVQILGKQCSLVAEPDSTLTDIRRALIDTLNCLKDHGLMAKPLM